MDTRIVKTKLRLMSALSELLKDHDIDSITVSELCKKAGVNRTTFYKYYNIPRDVGKESFDRHMTELMKEIHTNRPDTLYQTMLYCCREYRENYNLTSQIFPGIKISEKELSVFYLGLQADTVAGHEHQLRFIAGGSAAVVNHWLSREPEISPEDIALVLTDMIQAVLKT